MAQQKRIDKILQAVEARVQDEVGALLGADFILASGARKRVSKEEAFESLVGKQICAHLDITGEVSGKSCLLVNIKDAIRLGGTLIMLPDSELQEVIGREEYREEIEDSFGEIANIIAGSITKDFEEMYPKPCRFVRKEQEVLVPAKVDIESDNPVINQQFYLASCSMMLDGKQLGDLVLLLPAAAFGLEKEEISESTAAEVVKNDKAPQNKPAKVIAKEQSESTHKEIEPSAQIQKKSDSPKIDFAKQKKRINQLLAECQTRLSKEMGALLGVDIILDDLDNTIISKEEFFSERAVGKQVLTAMEVVGELQDTCYFAVGLKDAIHLGGTLIMLPPAELTNVVNEEDFSDDITDAYGEVANIVSGVYTAVFEEQYSKKLRFIKKNLQLVVPLKVETASDDPIPNKSYYLSKLSLAVDGKSLGSISMLFPAALLQLDTPPVKEVPEQAVSMASGDGAVAEKTPQPQEDRNPASPDKPVQRTAQISAQAKDNLDKQRKRIDKLLGICREKMEGEVSALLGVDVKLSNQNNTVMGKEVFFSDFVSGKQVIANMDVVGDLEGKSYLIINLRDAIRIGGALIMLPSSELESVVAEEEFNEDTKDAFGEIANIIAGVYTAGFEEQHTKRLRFIKTDLNQVVPMKVDPDADEPFPNDEYYLSTMDLSIGENALGKVNVIFPLEILQLEGLRSGQEVVDDEVVADEGLPRELSPRSGNNHSDLGEPLAQPASLLPPDILLIGDDEREAGRIASVLEGMGYSVKSLSFKDNVHNYIPGRLKAVYLVMKDVNEQAFGAAIKVSSACSLPIIAAGPSWTRTKVIKAVKYGVLDILLTPAAKADIEENVTKNLLKLAA